MAIVATVNFDQLLDYRFDAECYQPDLQAVETRISARSPRLLETVASVSDGNHVSIADHFCASGVRYLKGSEVSEVFIDDEEPTYIPRKIYQAIARAHVNIGDVLASVIGSVGPVALVTEKYKQLSCSCKLAILRPFGISGEVLLAYLLSPSGQSLLLRRRRGSVQQGVVLPDIRSFPVPAFDDELMRKVEVAVNEAAAINGQAETLYPEAQRELSERLGWQALRDNAVELTYACSISDISVQGRMDSEFFHPHYARIRSALGRSGRRLADIVASFDKGTQPEEYVSDGEIVVVKSKQVTTKGIAIEKCERARAVTWNDRGARLAPDDLVINSTGRGTLGRAAVFNVGGVKAVAAVDLVIAHLRRELVDPEYVALFLNSPVGLAQTEQFQTGSSGQLHLYPQHFAEFIIFLPMTRDGKPDLKWQESLGDQVRQSFSAAIQARRRLEEAIQLIENAINPDYTWR